MTVQWNKVVLSIFFWRSTVFASKVWGYMKHAAIFEKKKKICNVDLFSQPVVTDMKSIFFFIWNHTVLSLVFHDGMKVHVHVATSIALQEKKLETRWHIARCVFVSAITAWHTKESNLLFILAPLSEWFIHLSSKVNKVRYCYCRSEP